MVEASKPDFTHAHWRKSVNSSDGECVEVAMIPGAVGVRDSKEPGGPHLVFTRGEWAAWFIKGAKSGEFDND